MKVSSINRLILENKFRELIWRRDGGIDRATGQRLLKAPNAISWCSLGDVCHLKPKGPYPELKYEPSNAFLMCRELHIASDGRGGYRLKISGNANEELTFVMSDQHGHEIWRRVSKPPAGVESGIITPI